MKAIMAEALQLCDAIDHMSGEVKFQGDVEFTEREKELIRAAADGAVKAAHSFLQKHQQQIRVLAIAYEKQERPRLIISPHGNDDDEGPLVN
jgi:hypothetical protein